MKQWVRLKNNRSCLQCQTIAGYERCYSTDSGLKVCRYGNSYDERWRRGQLTRSSDCVILIWRRVCCRAYDGNLQKIQITSQYKPGSMELKTADYAKAIAVVCIVPVALIWEAFHFYRGNDKSKNYNLSFFTYLCLLAYTSWTKGHPVKKADFNLMLLATYVSSTRFQDQKRLENQDIR